MSVSSVPNKIASAIIDPEARVKAQCQAQLVPLRKERDGIVADLLALSSAPAKHSMEMLVKKHDPKALRKELAKVDAKIEKIENIMNSGKSAAPVKVAAPKATDEVTYAAPPRAERATSQQKTVLQAPPENINNLGAQIAAKQAIRKAPPRFTAED